MIEQGNDKTCQLTQEEWKDFKDVTHSVGDDNIFDLFSDEYFSYMTEIGLFTKINLLFPEAIDDEEENFYVCLNCCLRLNRCDLLGREWVDFDDEISHDTENRIDLQQENEMDSEIAKQIFNKIKQLWPDIKTMGEKYYLCNDCVDRILSYSAESTTKSWTVFEDAASDDSSNISR